MGDRRSKKRGGPPAERQAGPDVFAEFGLSCADFDVDYGGGKSFLSGQRIVYMTVRHRASGRTASGKIGTTKRDADHQRDELLCTLLRSFVQS
ncbi:MAG: hypothetical protein JWM11_4196 [Planctomycetaceae bacterium]|nr:hypothetical protein [Planctomycetaceae bacterium]